MPTATRTPRTPMLLKLFSDRIGEWISAPELAAAGGAQYSAVIFEMKSQGHDISQRIEYHQGQTLTWFRLNRTRTW
jgi:hypothetical protein